MVDIAPIEFLDIFVVSMEIRVKSVTPCETTRAVSTHVLHELTVHVLFDTPKCGKLMATEMTRYRSMFVGFSVFGMERLFPDLIDTARRHLSVALLREEHPWFVVVRTCEEISVEESACF